MRVSLTKEQSLLLVLCNRTFEANESLESMVTDDLDWTQVFTDAMWHKVLFIVLENLLTSGLADLALTKGNLPLLLLNHWKQLFYVNAIRNRIHFEEVESLFNYFRALNIDLAVSKGGIALIDRVYTLSSRKMYDIDLIANREQHKEIMKAFSDLGYQMGGYDHGTDRIIPLPKEELRKWLLHTRGLPNFIKVLDCDVMKYLIVQVQYQLGSTLTHETVSSKALLSKMSGEGIHIISDIDLLIQLVLHLYRETKEESFQDWNMDWNLIKFCDLDRYLHYLHSRNKMDRFIVRASELNLNHQCVYSLKLINEIFPSEVTQSYLKHFLTDYPDTNSVSVPNQIYDLLFSVGRVKSKSSSKWSEIMEVKTI